MAQPTLHSVKPTEKGAGGFCHAPVVCVQGRCLVYSVVGRVLIRLLGFLKRGHRKVELFCLGIRLYLW